MANYTPEQIEEFLQEFFDVVGTRQYVGARYVPIFGRRGETSIAWDNTAPYEPLTIVLYQGNSFTSRQYVPAGVDILNADYWANTGNYNSQVEAYRREVLDLKDDWQQYVIDTDASITQWKTETENELDQWKDDTVQDFETAIGNLPSIIPSSAFSPTNTVKDYIDAKFVPNAIMFSDSWGADSPQLLGTTMKDWFDTYIGSLDVFAASGATFGGLIGPVNTSVATLTEAERLAKTHVLILAGLNSASGESSAQTTAYDNVFSAIRQYYPNAEIHWFPNGANSGVPYPIRYVDIRTSCLKYGAYPHMETIPCLRVGSDTTFYAGADLYGYRHPNTNGALQLIKNMWSLIKNGTIPTSRSPYALFRSDDSTKYIHINVTEVNGILFADSLTFHSENIIFADTDNSVTYVGSNEMEIVDGKNPYPYFNIRAVNGTTWLTGAGSESNRFVPFTAGTITNISPTQLNTPFSITFYRPQGITGALTLKNVISFTGFDPIYSS